MPTLVIIEPNFDGHRGGYVSLIAKASIERHIQVKIATLSANLSHPILSELRELSGDFLELVILNKKQSRHPAVGTFNLVRKEIKYWWLFKKLYEESVGAPAAHRVIVPYLDHCANAIALFGSPFGSTRWSGIVMRQVFHFPALGIIGSGNRFQWVKERLFEKLLCSKYLRSLLTIDESLANYISARQEKGAQKLKYVPDPANGSTRAKPAYARKVLAIPSNVCVILVYGGITERKGVGELLTALSAVSVKPEVHGLIAGRQNESVRERISSKEFASLRNSGRLHQIDKFLNAEEEALVFGAADIVWLGYRDFDMMSGVLVQAGYFGLPVIATSSGLIGSTTTTHQLGLVAEIRDTIKVQEAITLLAGSSELRMKFGRNGYTRFLAHTPREFSDAVLGAI